MDWSRHKEYLVAGGLWLVILWLATAGVAILANILQGRWDVVSVLVLLVIIYIAGYLTVRHRHITQSLTH